MSKRTSGRASRHAGYTGYTGYTGYGGSDGTGARLDGPVLDFDVGDLESVPPFFASMSEPASGSVGKPGRRPRRRWPAMLLAAPLIFALAGCSLGRPGAPAQLFDLGPPTGAAPVSGADPSSLSRSAASSALAGSASGAVPAAMATTARRAPVAISFSAAQMLTDTGVIWRVGDSSNPHSYATYRWAAPPSQLVQQRVIDRLSAAGPVVQDGVDPRAPLLQVTLTRFEQVYAEDGKSSVGQVAMQAVLVRDHSVVDSVQLARSAPAPTQDAQGGVVALRAATDAAAGDLSTWLERRLSAAADRGSDNAFSNKAASSESTSGGLTWRSSP